MVTRTKKFVPERAARAPVKRAEVLFECSYCGEPEKGAPGRKYCNYCVADELTQYRIDRASQDRALQTARAAGEARIDALELLLRSRGSHLASHPATG